MTIFVYAKGYYGPAIEITDHDEADADFLMLVHHCGSLAPFSNTSFTTVVLRQTRIADTARVGIMRFAHGQALAQSTPNNAD
jgi:hypothetical protein